MVDCLPPKDTPIQKPHSDADLPIITILIPLYREERSLPFLKNALSKLDYPREKLDIKLLMETDDYLTRQKAEQLFAAPEYHHINLAEHGPRTKPKACNYGLWLARGQYTVIYDAEDRPEPDQLKKAVMHFAQTTEKTACLQARLNYYNSNRNLITRLFTIEYTLLFDLILPALGRVRAPIPLGGTSNFFKTDVLFEIGGWDPHNVTEDADIGMRLARHGYEFEMLASTTWEEATPDIKGWLRQRSRWIKGYLQTWLVHSRHLPPFSSTLACLKWLVTLHIFIGGTVLAAFFNPIFWTLCLIWMTNISELATLFPYPINIISLLIFLSGNFGLIILNAYAPLKRMRIDLMPFALFMPLYWVMQSVAGFYGLWQFFRRPFYWEKTDHHRFIDRELEAYLLNGTDHKP